MQQAHAPRAAIAATSAALVVLAVYLLRLDRIAGLIVDDAWYVLLGQALAQGRGFRLVSSAAAEILPVVPPGFPALLAIVFGISPSFPANVLLLKSVSIVSMLAAGIVTGYYFLRWRREPWPLALALAVATTITPAFVFLATSTVMAECVFMLAQMAAIVLIEWSVAEREGAWTWKTAAAAVTTAAATLLRATGLALIAAAVLYLLYKGLWRRAIAFGIVVLVCMLPWTIYSRVNAPTEAQRLEHGGSIVLPYTDSMRMRIAADPASGRATPRDLASRLAGNLATIVGKDVIGIVFPEALRGASESGQEVISIGSVGELAGSMGNAWVTIGISLVVSALMALGFAVAWRSGVTAAEFLVPLSLALIVLVPYQTFRYVLALAPFLFCYLAGGISRATRSARPARIVLLCVIGFAFVDHVQYLSAKFGAAPDQTIEWFADSAEIDQVLGWMNERLHDPAAVATTNPPLVYLRTGRKTVGLGDLTHRWRGWKAEGIRYLVCLVPAELPSPSDVSYRLLYQTSRHKLWVIEI
jgi:hypothetical protein